jgi:hypothetical protein
MEEESDWTDARPRWGRRILVGLLVIVLLVVGAFAWLTVSAGRTLEARVARYQADGVPILPADFLPKPIPDDTNAARDYEKAIAAMTVPETQRQWFNEDFDLKLPLTEGDLAQAEALIVANAEAINLARTARGKPAISWNMRFTSPVGSNINAPGSPGSIIKGVRGLSRLLATDTLLQFSNGQHASALGRLTDLEALAHAADQQPLITLNHLVAMAVSGLSSKQAIAIAETVNVDASTRPLLESLIAGYTNRSLEVEHAQRAWQGERMSALDGLKTFAAQRPMMKTFILRDALLALDQLDQIEQAAAADNYPQAMASIPPRRTGPLSVALHPWTSTMSPAYGSIFRSEYRTRFHRRIASIALAASLYRADHGGAWPVNLEALVPKYLPEVPTDPFAGIGDPLRYTATPVPLVYGVGEDGVDHGGSTLRTSPNAANDVWGGKDWVFHLERAGAATAPNSNGQ